MEFIHLFMNIGLFITYYKRSPLSIYRRGEISKYNILTAGRPQIKSHWFTVWNIVFQSTLNSSYSDFDLSLRVWRKVWSKNTNVG